MPSYEKGCLVEHYPWSIELDQVFYYCERTACKHCVELPRGDPRRDPRMTGRAFLCPRTVKADNEAGYNSTVVCLDCILEAAAAL